MPGGAWLLARLARYAAHDLARFDLVVPVLLQSQCIEIKKAPSLVTDAPPSPAKANQPAKHFRIYLYSESIVWGLDALAFRLYLTEDGRLQVDVALSPKYEPSQVQSLRALFNVAQSIHIAQLLPAVESQWTDTWVKIEITGNRPNIPAPPSDAGVSMHFGPQDYFHPALIRELNGFHLKEDTLVAGKGTCVFFPGECKIAPLDDNYQVAKVAGTCALYLNDFQGQPLCSVPFNSFKPPGLSRVQLRFHDRTHKIPLDHHQQQRFSEAKRRESSPLLALVESFLHTEPDETTNVWWEVSPESRHSSTDATLRIPRLNRVFGYTAEDPSTSYDNRYYPPEIDPNSPSADGPHHLVLFDLNFGFCSGNPSEGRERVPSGADGPTKPPLTDWEVQRTWWREKPGMILVALGRLLPDMDAPVNEAESFWNWWHADALAPSQSIIVLSAQLLRASGIRISHRLSWERSVEDCLVALQTHPKLRALSCSRHLIIRFGCAGVLYVRNDKGGSPPRAWLVYDAHAHDGFHRDPEKDGRVLGSNCVLLSCILKSVLQIATVGDSDEPISAAIDKGLRLSLPAIQKFYDDGYSPFEAENDFGILDYKALEGVLEVMHPLDCPESHPISHIEVPMNRGWRFIQGKSYGSLLKAAISHVRFRGVLDEEERKTGDLKCMAVDGIHIPLANFGKFAAIAREEVDAYRSIQLILKRYLSGARESKPISLAVFGPPGSGKSFGIRQVAESIHKDRIAWIECNLAQFSSPDDLVIPLLKARDVQGDKTPMILLDEFDSKISGAALGWLRYLLQPMQDGSFKHGEEVRTIGRAIMVFAGGTSESFREFSCESGEDEAKLEFRRAKGPDFVSRLSGYIDTLGINPKNGDRSIDTGFVLRRAVLLRSLIEQRGLLSRSECALVDESMIRTLLTLEEYKHGARSMEILLKMCVGEDGAIRLPAPKQLEVHVGKSDAEALWSSGG